MKKIFSILILALCAIVVGCSDDETTKPEATLKVVRSDSEFNFEGGIGVIEIQSIGTVTATSSESWCQTTVIDNKVSLTVERNETIDSRTVLITLQSGNEETHVRVTQLGDTFDCDLVGEYSFAYLGGKMDFTFNTDREYKITTTNTEGWLTYELKDKRIVITVNPVAADTGVRIGTITITSNKNTWVSTFSQRGFAGTYTMEHTRSDGKVYAGTCTFTAEKEEGVYGLICKGVPLGNAVPIKAVLADGLLTIDFNKQYLGNTTDGAVYLCAFNEASGFLNFGPDVKYVAKLMIDKNNMPYFKFEDVGSWEGYTVDGFYYGLFTPDGQFTGSGYGSATNITMIHQ